MDIRIVFLPGDGIGPEVVHGARRILDVLAEKQGFHIYGDEYLIGGAAIDETGTALPDDTLEACRQADAVLLGAVGGPKWDDPKAHVRPEQGLLGLRKELGLFANIRPVKPHPSLLHASPLKSSLLKNVDLLVVRELTGGIYFGQPQGRKTENGTDLAVDTMSYTTDEVERIANLAFQLARERRGKVTSVDKANVLASSRLWREVVEKVGASYTNLELEHILVDAAAMYLLQRPSSFDVMLTSNMFGDILTDEASVLTGSMGNLPSASLGEHLNQHQKPRGLYEPIHGSAPDIAGMGIANPIGTVLSAAMMLRYSFGRDQEAALIERAVDMVVSNGGRTADLVNADEQSLSTVEMVDEIIHHL